MISPELSGAAKPDPASFRLAVSRLNVTLEKPVIVGYSIRRDIEPAQQLGMTAVYAKYGDPGIFLKETPLACRIM